MLCPGRTTSSLLLCVIFCQVDERVALFFIFHFLYVCPLCCKDVPSFDSSLSIQNMTHIDRLLSKDGTSLQHKGHIYKKRKMKNKANHMSTWQNMKHIDRLLSKDGTSLQHKGHTYIQKTENKANRLSAWCVIFCQVDIWLAFFFIFRFLYICPLCCKDVPSFDSSLSICVIFCQADKRLALFSVFCMYVCPLCCKDVPSFDSSLSICFIFCQVDIWLALFFIFRFLYICPLCCKDVPSFDSSLSICVIFCQADKRLALFFPFFVCMYVSCAVKMFHLLTAACQYVSYFVRWTNDWLCFIFHFLYVCPLCCEGVPSFDSSLSTYGTEYFSMCHCAGFSQMGYTQAHGCIWWMCYCTCFMFYITPYIEVVHDIMKVGEENSWPTTSSCAYRWRNKMEFSKENLQKAGTYIYIYIVILVPNFRIDSPRTDT